VAVERRKNWQLWRQQQINILEQYIKDGRTCELLEEPPKEGMKISQYVAESCMKKALSLQLFLWLMYFRDDPSNDNVK